MSNADDFEDRSLRERSLSPSHTVRISDFPYTAPLGLFHLRCKPSLGHMGYPSPYDRGQDSYTPKGHLYLVTPSYHLTMIPCLSAHTDCSIVCAQVQISLHELSTQMWYF